MTLQPYDGANRVHLPNGRTCWEKETKHYGFSETTRSYQYSIEIGDLPTDWNGRVIGLKLLASDGSWNEIVTFLPVSMNLIDRVRAVMGQGWKQFAVSLEPGSSKLIYSAGYLRVMHDVLVLLQSGVRS